MKEIRKIIEDYDFNKSFLKCSLVSVVNVNGSSYRRVGARMLVYENGTCLGGISGGCLEGDALKKAQKVIFDNKPQIVRYDTSDPDDHQIGVSLGCRGIIDVLITPIDVTNPHNQIEILRSCLDKRDPQVLVTIVDQFGQEELKGTIKICDERGSLDHICNEDFRDAIRRTFKSRQSNIFENEIAKVSLQYLEPDIHLIIFGNQYDTYPLIRVAKEIGWKTSIVGVPQKLNRQSMIEAGQVFNKDENWPDIDPYSAVIIMSHDFNVDTSNLRKVVSSNTGYIGLLGPKVRSEELLENLEMDLTDDQIEKIHGPSGLDIGANTPEEIAISIIAEIKARFSDRDGHFLRDRKAPIHSRKTEEQN